jgi:hypothetical protein
MLSRNQRTRSGSSLPRRGKAAASRATAQRALRFEVLENRRLLAINLFYGGTHNPVTMFDLDGSADNVSLSQPEAKTLKIDLHGVHFGPLSDPAASGLTYEVPGQPTLSTWATIDLTAAGAVPNLSLNTGDGDDRIQLVALSSPNLGNLQIAGQGGNDTVTLYGEPNVPGYVDIDAETIIRLGTNHPPTDLALSNSVVYARSVSGDRKSDRHQIWRQQEVWADVSLSVAFLERRTFTRTQTDNG